MQYRPTRFVPLLLILAVVVAGCEDAVVGDDEQTFEAELFALNGEVLPDFGPDEFDGEATFTLQDGEFIAEVTVEGVAPGIAHPQHIHFGPECPTPAADDNGDGFVDVPEGAQFYGPILVPLDFQLSAQAEGTFPMTDDGSYQYQASIPLAELVNSLQPEDEDIYAELGPNETLNLTGRTVVIHGVPQSTEIPDSFTGIPATPDYLAVPIACGTIEAVD